MKSFYPFEEISSLLRMTQQCQRILLLENFPVYQQLSASTSSEAINCKAERKQTKRFKESRNNLFQQGLAFVVERNKTASHVAGLNRIQCYAVLLVLVLTSILLVI